MLNHLLFRPHNTSITFCAVMECIDIFLKKGGPCDILYHMRFNPWVVAGLIAPTDKMVSKVGPGINRASIPGKRNILDVFTIKGSVIPGEVNQHKHGWSKIGCKGPAPCDSKRESCIGGDHGSIFHPVNK